MKKSSIRPFTLTELLAVVVCLFAFATVGISAINGTANAAFDVACQNNLNQIGRFTAQFVSDNQGSYPVALRNGKDTWFSCMRPYVEAQLLSNSKKFIDPVKSSSNDVSDSFGGIFRCPADNFRREKSTVKAAYALSYALHGNVGSDAANGVTKASEVKEPSVKAYRMDCTYAKKPNGVVNLNNMNWILGLNKKKNDKNGEVAFRHGEGTVNILFLDGHVAALSEQECLQSASKMLAHQK